MAVFDMYMSIRVHVRSWSTAPLISGCEVSKQKQKIVFGMGSLGWVTSTPSLTPGATKEREWYEKHIDWGDIQFMLITFCICLSLNVIIWRYLPMRIAQWERQTNCNLVLYWLLFTFTVMDVVFDFRFIAVAWSTHPYGWLALAFFVFSFVLNLVCLGCIVHKNSGEFRNSLGGPDLRNVILTIWGFLRLLLTFTNPEMIVVWPWDMEHLERTTSFSQCRNSSCTQCCV